MSWSVYILRCCDGTLYTGIAVDLRGRLEAHQRGVAAKYTLRVSAGSLERAEARGRGSCC